MQDSALIQIGLPIALMIIMCGIGMSLTPTDFRRIGERPKPVLVGLLGHYLWLPLLGFGVAWLFKLQPEYAVGLVLVAACPSGTSSNALTYLARGNVALAVTLTLLSGLITFASVPLLVNLALQLFMGETRAIQLPLGPTMLHLAALVLVPICVGMALRRFLPGMAKRAEPVVGAFALLLLAVLIVGIVLQERERLPAMLADLGLPVLTLCCVAILGGLLLARLSGLALRDALTVGMEVGVQNATLALLIAFTLLKSSEIAIPGALYGLLMYAPAMLLVLFGRRALRRVAGPANAAEAKEAAT
ncbi:MAG TPA: bile acid:sodium symporter family protein [Lysobacter sp.]